MQRLEVRSREFDASADWQLLEHLPNNPLIFSRQGDGLVGYGEAARLSASGEHRLESLAEQWRELCTHAFVDDELQTSGSGLIAFGSFAFADQSDMSSVLVVPRVVLGKRDDRTWITEIVAAGEAFEYEDELPEFATQTGKYAPAQKVVFTDGDLDREGFTAAVARAVEHIRNHEIEKVVLARDIEAAMPVDADLRANLARLANRFATCWTYSVDGMIGASPELLVRVANGEVSARVLAGTAGRGTDPSIDIAISQALAGSAKNRNEHAFAVDSLVRSLTPYCTAIEADAEPFSLALPNLWHLASDVRGALRDNASSIDLAAALHPTAAVAGTPTQNAKRMLAELEGFDRGRYAGPVGWIGADGDGEWAIALRGAQLADGKIRAYAGCGIVAGSDPEAELAETELKFAPMRNAFA